MRMRYFIVGFGLLLSAWVGSKTYTYFFDSSIPELKLLNLEEDCYYCGDMQCAIASTKSGDVSIWLDDQPLVNQSRLSASSQGHQFSIPTKTIANGKHTLKALLTDHTYQKNEVSLERSFYVDNIPLQAALIKTDTDFKVFQGRTLHVQFQANKEIKESKFTALSSTYDCFSEAKN